MGALIELVMARPIVNAALIARELKITSRAAQTLVTELGLTSSPNAGAIEPGASGDRSLCAWLYSHPRSPNAVRSTPGGAYHPPAR